MQLQNNVKIQILKSGYKSIRAFAKAHKINYENLNYLASGQAKSINMELLEKLCNILDCEVNDLLTIQKEGA